MIRRPLVTPLTAGGKGGEGAGGAGGSGGGAYPGSAAGAGTSGEGYDGEAGGSVGGGGGGNGEAGGTDGAGQGGDGALHWGSRQPLSAMEAVVEQATTTRVYARSAGTTEAATAATTPTTLRLVSRTRAVEQEAAT